jgi:uncharacterized protein YbaR (Trm112 family)
MTEKSELCRLAARWFAAGENVIQAGSALPGVPRRNLIEIAYDLQAGSYTESLADPDIRDFKERWGVLMSEILAGLGVTSACEPGVGEASTLAFIAARSPAGISFSGFDISLSRLLFARRFLSEQHQRAALFCADLFHVPLADSSVDAVITSHSIEPNGGFEEPILRELLRVAARYLILVEPDYDLGDAEQKRRMAEHGYVRDLVGHLKKLPGKVLRYEPWPLASKPVNKPSLIVFEKANGAKPRSKDLSFVAPVTKEPLAAMDDFLFCRAEGLLYPVVFGIPVLRDDCAILCSHPEARG